MKLVVEGIIVDDWDAEGNPTLMLKMPRKDPSSADMLFPLEAIMKRYYLNKHIIIKENESDPEVIDTEEQVKLISTEELEKMLGVV